jgi:hypothetical protein
MKEAEFWTVLRIYYHVPSSDSFSRLLYAVSSLSFSAQDPPTQVTATDNGGRVLDGSAHLKSCVLIN